MSSLDSVLLVMAATTERDLVGLVRAGGSDVVEVRRTRLWVGLFAVITALMALRPAGGIVALTVLSGSLYAACFVPAVLLGLYWRRGTGAAVLSSFAIGIGVLLVWPRFTVAGTVHQIFPAVLLSVGVYVFVARRSPRVQSAVLDRLFAGSGAPVHDP